MRRVERGDIVALLKLPVERERGGWRVEVRSGDG